MDKQANNTPARMKTHRVALIKDSQLVFPDLWFEVFIAGDEYEERAFANMFIHAQCRKAKTPETADLVVFTGGPDVDPALYGQTPHESTKVSPDRDKADLELYALCLEKGIPMFGVCRGAQFLHVMNGGELYQDIDNHYQDHMIYDPVEHRVIQKVSSVHHQMCIRNKKMTVIAENGDARERWLNASQFESGKFMDVEGFWYRDTCCLGVQGHPEYRGYNHFMQWTLGRIDKYINENPDIENRDGYRRIKQSILDERKMMRQENMQKEHN